MRTALTAICSFTILASCWLFVMYLVLRHPGFEWRAAVSLGIASLSALTLATVRTAQPGVGIRVVAACGAAALAGVGIWAIKTNVDDGFIDLIGLAFIMQGVLTIIFLVRPVWRASWTAHP